MHRLQLVAFIFLAAILVVAIYSPIRFVSENDRALALAPFGYTYQAKPFTGIVYNISRQWRPLRLTFVSDGKLNGADIHWYDNGQRSIERHYAAGMESGEHKAWFQDGAVKFFKTFVAGVPHGEFYEWHSNGQLAQYVLFDHGKELAAKSWTAGGKPFYNYVWDENFRIGLQGDRFCSPRKR